MQTPAPVPEVTREARRAATYTRVLTDLRAECADLEALLTGLGEEDWRRATPADGWTVAHQVAHLAWTEEACLVALESPADFEALRGTSVDAAAADGALRGPACLARWRASSQALRAAFEGTVPTQRLPWFGPPMSALTAATARVMEVWAHGHDVADALGVARAPTARLRHVAQLGVAARDYAFGRHGLTPPSEPFRVELQGPGGEVWAWGPADAPEHVRGSGLGFALLCTRRRHRDDVDVVAEGAQAEVWLGIAQAYAGPPGPGRPPTVA